jgi:Family of unknown function (DUF6220)
MIESPTAKRSVPDGPALVGYRRRIDDAYGYLMGIFVAAVLVQIYLAGVGAFGKKGTHSFNPHENLGHVLGVAAVVIFVLALVAHESTHTMVWAFVLALLTEVAQEGLAHAGHHTKWIGGLHSVDAALILALSVWLLITWRRRRPVP